MKALGTIFAFLLVLPGIAGYLIGIPPDATQRAEMLLIGCVAALMLVTGKLTSRAIAWLIAFAVLICAVPLAVKGYDSTLVRIIFTGLLGYLAYHYLARASFFLALFAAMTVYFVVYYISNGTLEDVFYAVVDGETIGVSRNFVGIALLHCYLIYYAVSVRTSKRPAHWPIWIMPAVAAMASGVSSLMVSLLLLLLYLGYLVRIRIGHASLAVLAAVIGTALLWEWFEATHIYTRLTEGGVTHGRLLLWLHFFSQFDVRSFFVGFDAGTEFSDHLASGMGIANLHNSYLNLYYKVGVFAFVYFAVIAYTAYALRRVNVMLFLIFVATLVRAGTDGYYFVTFLVDFIIVYVFLMTRLGSRLVGATGQASPPRAEAGSTRMAYLVGRDAG